MEGVPWSLGSLDNLDFGILFVSLDARISRGNQLDLFLLAEANGL
jgi:hypothetical protein